MKYSENDLKQLQSELKGILFEIDRICKKHNIKYFALAGTLLGSVRHGDMIPWDDDIDIGMLRKDYDRFVKIATEELKKPFFCLNFENYKAVPIYYSKICKSGTVFAEKEVCKLKYPHCIFVDVLPLDISPADAKKRKKQLSKIRFFYELFKSKTLWTVSAISSRKKKIIGNIVRPLLHIVLLPIPKSFIYKKLIHYSTLYKDEKDGSYVSYKGKEITLFPHEFFTNLIQGKFGSSFIPIPKEYDTILRQIYKDYTQLPPIDKRVSHSPYLFKL